MAVVFAITEPLLTMKEGSYFYSLDAGNELRTTGDLRRKGQLYSLGERTEGLPSRTEPKLLHNRMPSGKLESFSLQSTPIKLMVSHQSSH